MTRDGHVRFCEGPKVKFLRPTLLIIFNEAHLRRAISGYAAVHHFRPRGANCKITAEPVLGGLHHIYRRAA
jgi:hypothetical protein